MATIFAIMDAAKKRMEGAADLAAKLGYPDLTQTIREQIAEMTQRRLVVVVAGEVKRGKSLLLNMLLNETESVCPVDAGVCTNAVTILSYGEQESIQVCIADNKAPGGIRVETIDRARIPEYVSEVHNPNNFKNVIQIEAQLPNKRLKDGVVFVDTPGVGSMNPEHAEITYNFLPDADMLLFVTDVMEPVSETEVNFLKRAYGYCKSIIFPLTKIDKSNSYEEVMNGNREKISNALGIPGDEVTIVPVSSTAKLEYLQDNDLEEEWRQEFLENSNYEALENAIWSTIAHRQCEVRVLPYVAEVKMAMEKILDALKLELAALDDRAVAQDLTRQLNKLIEELKELQQDGAAWKEDLKKCFKVIREDIDVKKQLIGNDANSKVSIVTKEKKTKICKQSEYMELFRDVNRIIVDGVLGIRENVKDTLAEKVDEIQSNMGINISINAGALDRIESKPNEKIDIEIKKKSFGQKAAIRGRAVSKWSIPLAALGMGVGAVIGGLTAGPGGAVAGAEAGRHLGAGIGGLVGAVAGGFAAFTVNANFDDADVSIVAQKLHDHIKATMIVSGSNLKRAVDDLQESIYKSLTKDLQTQENTLKQTITSIKENINAETVKIPALKNALQEKIKNVQKMITVLEKMEGTLHQTSVATFDGAQKNKSEKPMPKESLSKEPVEYGFI